MNAFGIFIYNFVAPLSIGIVIGYFIFGGSHNYGYAFAAGVFSFALFAFLMRIMDKVDK